MKRKGILIIVSGFSGAGKGTLVKKLIEKYDGYALSISATTRQPRPGEADGREYFCVGKITDTAQSLARFGFFQIQRSYIINLKYIEKADSREITLCNGMKVTIGRTHSKEFKREFFKWRMYFDG